MKKLCLFQVILPALCLVLNEGCKCQMMRVFIESLIKKCNKEATHGRKLFFSSDGMKLEVYLEITI